MNMHAKLWINDQKGDDKIIAFTNYTIYKCNPRDGAEDDAVQSFKMNMLPAKDIFGIPLSYIREFQLQEGKAQLMVILNSGSEEQLTISDTEKREEIFAFFKTLLPGEAIEEKYSIFRAAKKPLIALGVVIGLFIWSMYIASGIEEGAEYEVVGGGATGYHSAAGIVLMLGILGTKKVLMIFLPLIAIALFAVWRKARKPPVMKRYVVKR
ncbi:hypothetical protein F0L74_27690 [Chitinophaga agrisoli]|uniref:Uncharacterized protein n=1 Tax=Chitinophaga agrisoli TaxID=2607653 RepID=A0A5B2VP46_9BACT|nr:hypothetical protein [Chitinophaga agrisoli]KAA2239967.1 hypothetical protein F0L74_27690 [Chitinophaga agrisoli]